MNRKECSEPLSHCSVFLSKLLCQKNSLYPTTWPYEKELYAVSTVVSLES